MGRNMCAGAGGYVVDDQQAMGEDAVEPLSSVAEAREQHDALVRVQENLLKRIDDAVSQIQKSRPGDEAHEHLEILRRLLAAQVTAYLEHFIARRATLFSQTSMMYAGAVGAPGVISTTLRGLIEGHTLSSGQAAQLAQFIGERRTLVIFGDRATGKSTLLNALFELVPLDDRFVAVERGPDLPALKQRSFCVRLTVDRQTDLAALFAKARRMTPSRLVVGELHAAETRQFFALLAEESRVAGMATLRAQTVHSAVEAIVSALASGDSTDRDAGAHADEDGRRTQARAVLARTRPILLHMHCDEKGVTRLAGTWSVEGADENGEIVVGEVPPPFPDVELDAEV
jgi:hypothetical protein